MTLGNKIAQYRKQLGITQDALAQKLEVTNQAVSKWESDQCCPDIMLLPRLADIFGISIDELFDRVPKAAPVQMEGLPWPDDETLRVVVYVGHTLLGNSRKAENLTFQYEGPALNIDSQVSVTCGDVAGNVDAGTSVTCGKVLGHVNAGSSVTCQDVEGNVDAGESVRCANVAGSVDAGDSVTCGNVGVNVDAGGHVKCESVGGGVDAGCDVTCGNVTGDVDAGANVTCSSVGGGVDAGGSVVMKK